MSQSYTITLWCGCRIYVACHPNTNVNHARVIEKRGDRCPVRQHQVGAKLWLWEILPDPRRAEPRIHYELLDAKISA